MPWVTVYTDTAPPYGYGWSSTMCTLSRDGSTCVYGFATYGYPTKEGIIRVTKNEKLTLSFQVVGAGYPGYGLAISADGTVISTTPFSFDVPSVDSSHIFTTSPISLPIESHILASQGATFTQSIQGTRANFTDFYSANVHVGRNFSAKLVQLSNIAYQASPNYNFLDGPYTTALSSDGTTLVLGYSTRIDIFDIGSQTVVFTYSQTVYSASINASADVVVAGDASTSSVYIYRKTSGTWAYETKITRTNNFGFSVSLNAVGDKFLASSLTYGSGGYGGDSYMYTYTGTWGGPTTTFPLDATYVALSGDGTTCVFGKPSYTDVFSYNGAVLVTKDLGTTYTIYPGDADDDWFGYYVSCSYDGSTIIANSEPQPGVGTNYVKIISNGNVRKITYNFPSGACAVSLDGLTVAYGISGGFETDSVNIIKNYGTVNETTLVIPTTGRVGPNVFYGYGISLDNNGTKVSATGISATYYKGGSGSGTGHLYDIITVPSVIDITASGNSLNVLGGLNTSGSVVISGNSTLNGLEIRAVNYIRIETGTFNLSATISTNILLFSLSIYNATLNMPTSPVDGQITSFTVQLNNGTLTVGTGTVSPSFAGAAAKGATYKYVYSSAYDTWFGI